jgi:hypothetical protein
VVLQEGGVLARALLEEQGKRPLHLDQSVRMAKVGAGDAAVAERARRLGQAERLGKVVRAVGGGHSLGVGALVVVRHGELRVGGDECGAGRLLLEQRDGVGGERDMAALAKTDGDARQHGQCPRFGLRLAARTKHGERLLEGGRGFALIRAGLGGGFRPADH